MTKMVKIKDVNTQMEFIETPNVKIIIIKAGAAKNQTMSLKPVGLILFLSTSMKSKVIDFSEVIDFID